MKKIILLAMVFVASLQNIAFCQNSNAVDNAVAKLKTMLTDHMVEKAFLHFDRPYPDYVTGEVVYFKAYLTMGERHQPSTISNILHVDLIDKNDVLMRSVSLQLTNGTGWGDFTLPDTLQKGVYRIRAYTQYMRNEKNPYYFDQFISVSSINNVDRVAENTAQGLKPDMQFFPEGGNLVTDVPAKVAFKAIGTNGLGINVKGVVIDNEHKEVAKIASANLGMGEFNFIPEAGKSYKAMVTFGNGTQATLNLPAAQQKGITLFVNTDNPAKVSIEIRANRDYYKENMNKQLNLLVYYGGVLKRYTPKLDSEVLGLDLPASTFPTGIVKVTLLAENGEPLNERLVFIQNPDQLNLSLTANKPVYAKRENVQLNFSAKDKDGAPVNGSFSVSVVDESKILVDENAENTILSYLLLSTEVKGYIEKPNFYFANVTKETRADLDILMLTQGYRRFEWKQLENAGADLAANTFVPEKEISISGVLKSKSGAPVANCVINFISQTAGGGTPQVQTTDNEGRFTFSNIYVAAGTKYILKAQTSAGKNSVLTLDKPAAGPDITAGNPLDVKYDANADMLASLESNQRPGVITAGKGTNTVMLKTADEATAPMSKTNYRSSSLVGPGHADQVVLGNEIKNSTSLSTGLSGLLRSVQFSSGRPFLTTGVTVQQGMATIDPMLVIVDGVELGSDNINIVNPQDVEAVEVFKGPSATIYGSAGGQGVMVITTRETRAELEVISKVMSPGIFSIEPKGYYKAREFYSPAYGSNQASNNLSDSRTTIFWKPDVITDTGGNATLNFYNADGKGTYRVEVEGTDSKGNLGVQVFRYKVE